MSRREESFCHLLDKVKQLPAPFHSAGNQILSFDLEITGAECQRAPTCAKASSQLGTAVCPNDSLASPTRSPGVGCAQGCGGRMVIQGRLLPAKKRPPKRVPVTSPLPLPTPGADDAVAKPRQWGTGGREAAMAAARGAERPSWTLGKGPEHPCVSPGPAAAQRCSSDEVSPPSSSGMSWVRCSKLA